MFRFIPVAGAQIVTGRREAIRKLDIRVYYFKNLMLSNRIVCINYRIYPHIIKFVWG